MRNASIWVMVVGTLAASIGLVASNTAGAHGPTEIFTDITVAAGINWKHINGESADRNLIEAMGGGSALVDFDGDGRLDIFLVTGGVTPKGASNVPPRNALYRNLGNGNFEDVAEKAGVGTIGFYGMGVAAGDYDNDGFPDLFVTGYPTSALFHNNGNGTFSNVTLKAGVSNAGKWAASAAWVDYDRDGKLDLFVCNYVRFSFAKHPTCDYKGESTYCAQTAYEGEILTLYHNNGDHTFTDVTQRAGLSRLRGRALGVIAVDVNGDGWPDLVVARDASPNLVLINGRNGTFQDRGEESEMALNIDGNARAGMGIDAADINGDGRPDFVITNFNDEYHSLYLNPGHFPFEEKTMSSGLAAVTRRFVGWGAHFLDYDNDGNPDLMIATGHINRVIEQTRQEVSYLESPLLLRNSGRGVFQLAPNAGPAFAKGVAGRGLAVGDIDNDGDTDCILTRLADLPILLRNNVGQDSSWIGLQLEGTKSNRDAIGAKVIIGAEGRRLTRWITGGSSYLSSHDKRLLFGLGKRGGASMVNAEIHWPSGQIQTASNLAVGQYHRILEPQNAAHQ
jgi:hypothetical protein